MRKLLFLFGMFLVVALQFVSADTQTFTMKFIVPDTSPYFNNLRNFNHIVSTDFSQSITASSDVGISCYWLNDTTKFDVDCSGLITNVTNLNTIEVVTLKITVNNTIGEETNGDFYINIQTGGASYTCRYKKFGYYNLNIPFFKESDCVITEENDFTLK